MERGHLANPAARNAGFTLLELLVALALVALIVGLLGGGIRFGAKVWETSRIETGAIGEVMTVRRFIRERVLSARPGLSDRGGGDGAKTAFRGGVDAFRMVTLMPSYAAPGGLYNVEITQSAVAGGGALELSWWPVGADEAIGVVRHRLLLEEIVGVTISYFGDPEGGVNPAWHESWHGNGIMPRLISVKVAFSSGDPRVWPELVVPLPTSGSTALSRREL